MSILTVAVEFCTIMFLEMDDHFLCVNLSRASGCPFDCLIAHLPEFVTLRSAYIFTHIFEPL